MALGPYPLISLALAREKQADIRRLILEGINPAEKRREEKRGGGGGGGGSIKKKNNVKCEKKIYKFK